MFYVPIVNYIGLLIGFLCIGFAPDFHYVQFGGVIASHLFFTLICISCRIFIKFRNNLGYSFLNFCFFILMLCNSVIDLVQISVGFLLEVGENKVAGNIEKIIISILTFETILYIIGIVLDVREICKGEPELVPQKKRKLKTKITRGKLRE